MTTPTPNTLAAMLWPAASGTAARNLLLVLGGSLLVAVSAQIEIPFWPVPMTMQVWAVLAIGLAYGARLGGATLGLYLAEGAIGLPVFAGGAGGPAVFMGPTGGYLIGFVLSAIAVGFLADRGWGASLARALAAGSVGLALIYGPGLLWLGSVVGWDKPVLEYGFTPFILADLVKLMLAALAVTALWKAIKNPV
jgi:biotin transport system substrate-specific component